MKIKKSTIIISSILALIPLALYFFYYNQLPDSIATSFGFDGTINGYTAKNNLVILMLMPAFIVGTLCVTPHLDPRKKNYEKFGKLYDYFIIGVTALLSVTMGGMVYSSVSDITLPIHIITPVLVGILFIFIGNYMPKMKQTYTMGIKTPWTLDNEVVWNKTHRLGGKCFIISGVAMLASPLFPTTLWVIFTFVMIATLVPVIMSYVYYQQEIKKENSTNK